MLSPQNNPTTTGIPINIAPKLSLGKVFNQGVETEIAFNKQISQDLYVGASGTFTYSKNKVIAMDELYRGDDYIYPKRVEGFALGQQFGYKIDWNSPGGGYFISQDELDQYEYIGNQPRLGDFVYLDLNEDGVIDEKDQVPIQYGSIPNLTYGLTLKSQYKSFDLSVMFYGANQVSRYFDGFGVTEFAGGIPSFFDFHKNAWTLERYANGREIDYPALSSAQTSSAVPNDFYSQNTSYLRLKSLEVGYTIPENIVQKMGVGAIRLYFNGQNLWTFDKLFFNHFDPELAGLAVPIPRIMNVGAQECRS